MSKRIPANIIVSFVGQKGGVGKSALARLLAVAAARQGRRVLLADFDIEQLTCLEWSLTRKRSGVEPALDVRAFKSLKKLRKTEEAFDLVVADTRGLADGLTREIAEESSVVFLPTGYSADDLRPTLGLARRIARRGGDGKIVLVLSKVGRSARRTSLVAEHLQHEGFDLLAARWLAREGIQAEFDAGRVGLESRNAGLRAMAQEVASALLERSLSETAQPPAASFAIASR